MTEYPNRIFELRRAKGWSQQELADRIGCSKMHVSGLERGLRELSLDWMRRIAKEFGVAPVEILSDEDNPYHLTEEEADFIALFRAADAQTRENIHRVTEALAPFRHFPPKAA